MSVLRVYWTFERLVPSTRTISGEEEWQRVVDREGIAYRRPSYDEEMRQDHITARKAFGKERVRVVRITQEVVDVEMRANERPGGTK